MVHAFTCQSLTFCSATQPFIWLGGTLSASLRPKYGTPYLFTSANPKHTLTSDVILRRTTLFQPISPPSGPCNAPWFSSETLALYKSPTYLLKSVWSVEQFTWLDWPFKFILASINIACGAYQTLITTIGCYIYPVHCSGSSSVPLCACGFWWPMHYSA